MFCGSEYSARQYALDSDGAAACDACRPQLETRMTELREEKAAAPSNPLGILLGAVLGGAAVFILTFLVLKLSYLSFLTGYAGLLLGKLTIWGAVLCTVLCLAAGLAAPVLHFAQEMSDHNMSQYVTATQISSNYLELEESLSGYTDEEIAALSEMIGETIDMAEYRKSYETAQLVLSHQTMSECLKDFRMLIGSEIFESLKPELVKCILFALLSIIAGAAVTAPAMLRESKGIHTLRELTA